MKEILKLGGILFLITAICSGFVSLASEVTKEPIAIKERETKERAMQEVMPEAEDFEEAQVSEEIEEAYTASKGGEILGYAISVAPKGYGGPIKMMVGVTKDGVVQGVTILQHGETLGLGANASDPTFTSQFKEKSNEINVVKGANPGEDEISAITGATITAQAVTDGVNVALDYVKTQEGAAQ